jgi:soluble lytic murein transglycosylase-like protein
MVVSAVPPLRGFAARMGSSVYSAAVEGRKVETRQLSVLGYSLYYGISFELAREIEAAALSEGIDPDLGFRVVQTESSFRERAVSSAGALGLTQLMPGTADWLQPGITEEEIFDRATNLRLGFRYLRWLLDIYEGNIPEALHAYNRGPGTVRRIRATGGDPANGYAERVLRPAAGEAYSGQGWLPEELGSGAEF